MPFLDDTGVREESRPPVPAAFATLSDQVERLLAVNLAWSLQLVPAFLALALPGLPAAMRIAMAAYTVLVLAPATGVLFAVARDAHAREHISLPSVRARFTELASASTRRLAPLYAATGFLMYLAMAGPAALRVLAGWALLLACVCATYWGPAFADDPGRSPAELVRTSVRLVWRRPGRTLGTCAAAAGCAALGIVSVGGLFLAVPVVVALLQTSVYAYVTDGPAGSAAPDRTTGTADPTTTAVTADTDRSR